MARPTLNVLFAHASKPTRQLIRRYQQLSLLMQLLPFDNSVVPNLNSGQSLAYSYSRDLIPRGAQFRDWYQDYPADFQTVDHVTTYLRPLGAAFEIDRVFVRADGSINAGAVQNFVNENVDATARATVALFGSTAINGDTASNPLAFDGLSKILDGTTSEFNGATLNIAEGMTKAQALSMYNALKRFVNRIRGTGLSPIIMANEDAKLRLENVAIELGYRTQSKDAFGEDIDVFAGAPIVDPGARPGTTGDAPGEYVIPTTTGAGASGGLTDIYVVGLGLSGFHGVTLEGTQGVRAYSNLTNTDPGVVKRVEAEMVGTVALKQTRAAAVLRDVRVQPQV